MRMALALIARLASTRIVRRTPALVVRGASAELLVAPGVEWARLRPGLPELSEPRAAWRVRLAHWLPVLLRAEALQLRVALREAWM